MAGAIIPLVMAVVSDLGPRIPEVVQFVENLFGHSAKTGVQDGAAKAQAAVSLLMTALQQLANAGKIAAAPVVDASLPAGLAGAVQQAFDALKAQGQLGPAVAAGQAGMKVTITGLMTGPG